MKVMKIKIKSRKEANRELFRVAKMIDSKQAVKTIPKGGIYFESLTAVRRVLTDKRLDVWRTIRDQKPDSITHLAEILKRQFRSVHRDVMLLEGLGLIKMTEGPGSRGNVQKLVSLYDELSVAVA